MHSSSNKSRSGNKVTSTGANDSRNESNNCSDSNPETIDATPNVSAEVVERFKDTEVSIKPNEWYGDMYDVSLDSVALSRDQIVQLQDIILDFFSSGELHSWKSDLALIFQGFVGSDNFKQWDSEKRTDLAFAYERINTLFEKLKLFHPTIQDAFRKSLKDK